MTTEAKAKELKNFAEKLCGMIRNSFSDNKKEKLSSLRRVRSFLPKNVGAKLLSEISGDLSQRKSGFVRLIKAGSRRSDGARMAVIEIIKKEKVER